mgnify:CR=1 FL=1
MGEMNHKKIKELQNKKAKIDAKIKELKQEPNNQDENIKQQIKNLTKQLDGKIELIEHEHGVSYRLTFPIEMTHTIEG